MPKLNVWDIISEIASEDNLKKKEVEKILFKCLRKVASSLQDGKEVYLKDFGTFKLHTRPPRRAFAPSKGEFVDVAERTIVKFRSRFEV